MKYYFIVNVASRRGKAKSLWKQAEVVIKRKKIPYKLYLTQYADHARVLAEEICGVASEGDCIVVVGGDGTVNETINGMHSFEKIRFGYIATGSGNDLGRSLGIDSSTPIEALEHILAGREPYPMDLGRVSWGDKPEESRLFAISSGIGMDAHVCELVEESRVKTVLNHLHLGSLTYLVTTVMALTSLAGQTAEISFDGKRKRILKRLVTIAAMNQKTEGGGIPFAPRADNQDGKLSVCCLYDMTIPQAFLSLPALSAGTHESKKGMEVIDCTSCKLHLQRSLPVHADGEYLGHKTDLTYTILPGKLLVQK